MRCLFLVVLLISSAGCVLEKTEGTSVPIEYAPEDLAPLASEHQNEFVKLSGLVSAGYLENGQVVCSQYYFFAGTDIRLKGSVLPSQYDLDGQEVTVSGILNTPVCDTPCECTPAIEVRTYSVKTGQAEVVAR